MDAMPNTTESKGRSRDLLGLDSDGLSALCEIKQENGHLVYVVLLEANIRSVSLEGLNHYRITVTRTDPQTGLEEKLRSDLEINLRQEMNAVSIEGSPPQYFTITRKSLDMDDNDIDSSIHEVVDLGLMDLRMKSGLRPNRQGVNERILFDAFGCNLIKASISSLLGLSTSCHRRVIQEAGHLFASRQDYVRDMCRCMATSAGPLSASVMGKARHIESGQF